MSFFRPEATALLRRYGEPALFSAIAVFGLGKGIELLWRGAWFGLVPTVLGALAAFAAIAAVERTMIARRGGPDGPGVVLIDEGRISFFSPHGGAVLALDDLCSVDILTVGAPDGPVDAYWVLGDITGAMARIPSAAENAEALVDVLGTLPGFDRMSVVVAMASTQPAEFTIWRRA